MLNKFFKDRVVYEIMWKDIIDPDRPQMTIKYSACWITKATRTYSEYVTPIALPRQQRLRERASTLHYMYTCIDSLV